MLEQIGEYESFYMYWVRSKIPKKVVCFEHLEKDPVNLTKNLTDFMRVPSRKNCLEKNTEGCLHRHHNEDYTYGHLFNTTVRLGYNSEFAFSFLRIYNKPFIRQKLQHVVENVSRLLRNRDYPDCTESFDNSLLN